MTPPHLDLQRELQQTLHIQPEDISTRFEAGQVRSYYRHPQQGSNANFFFAYDLVLVILDCAAPLESVLFLVTRWQDRHYPSHPPDNIAVEVDVLNDDEIDLQITIHGLRQSWHCAETPTGIALQSCPEKAIDA